MTTESHARIRSVFSGEIPDRPAFALWRHFPGADRSPEELTAATIAFARKWRPDLVKHTPNGMYAIEDWASQQGSQPSLEFDPDTFPYALNFNIDWRGLTKLQAGDGAVGRELDCLRRVCEEIGEEFPVYMTIFGPLTLAGKLAGGGVMDAMRDCPEDLHHALGVITQTMTKFTVAAREAGAAGLYFATQYASDLLLSQEDHATFGAPYDTAVLEAWGDPSSVILHLCGPDVFFDLCNVYPVGAVCWDHGLSKPSFSDAFGLTDCVLVAGMEEQQFPASIKTVYAQACDALAVSQGKRHILAPTCVIPAEASDESLDAVLKAVSQYGQSV